MDVHSLQQYLQSRFTGRDDFMQNIIEPIFGNYPFEEGWDTEMLEDDDLLTLAKQTGVTSVLHYGFIELPRNATHIFEVTVADRIQMNRNRVGMQRLVRRLMSGQNQQSAFMIFHYADQWQLDWRFSYCHYGDKEMTTAKRYTFLLGPGQACRTAAQNFCKLFEHRGELTPEDITTAFDVEALSKEFFNKYKEHYDRFCAYVYNNKENPELFGEEFTKWEDKTIRDYVKKLLGRIVFLHFLQKKGWMGVPADKDWGEGDRQFMKSLFDKATDGQKSNYLDEVLEPLFADALDVDRTANDDLFDCGVEGFRNVKIPYLNGGLFERDKMDEPKSTFSRELFADLFNFLYQYNFTIDENDPNDAEVGVDPEMLGRIFENLLEDNKDKGAFYTPKEIVQYMCKESLIAYLQTDIKSEEMLQRLRDFVRTYDVELIGGADCQTAKDVDDYLKAVKICDPAIGSGAFPMGLMKELYLCRSAIEGFDGKKAAEIKKHIIQQNIYGVDIEKGAVDIARLRFWLSLVLDEETPHALPNLDFKIMQGNSLLEQYKGVDLSKIMQTKKVVQGGVQLSFFENDVDELRRQLVALRNAYYRASNKQEKIALRASMRNIVQQQIEAQSNNVELGNIDIAETSEFFLWHTWFSEVFDKGGFDIVIGNPPYITMTKNNTDNDVLKAYIDGFVSIKRCYSKNIYTLFIELGIVNLLNSKGIISYIIPEGLFKTRSYEDCVSMMSANGDVLSYSTFDNYVFENAVTGSLIFNYRKEKQGIKPIHYAFDGNYNISIVPEEDTSIFDKITYSTKALKEIAELFKGMVVKDRQTVVFDTCDNNPDVFLLGKSIAKWTIKTPFFTDYNSITIIGGTKKKAKHDVAPRIVIRRTGDTLCCSLIEKAALTESTLYSCWSKDKSIDNKYLIAVLNSTLLDFYNKKRNITNQQGFPQILMTDLQGLPIKVVTKSQQQPIITLVDRILTAKKANPQADTTAEEREIDRLVYDLYGLTEDEIAIVEGKNEK